MSDGKFTSLVSTILPCAELDDKEIGCHILEPSQRGSDSCMCCDVLPSPQRFTVDLAHALTMHLSICSNSQTLADMQAELVAHKHACVLSRIEKFLSKKGYNVFNVETVLAQHWHSMSTEKLHPEALDKATPQLVMEAPKSWTSNVQLVIIRSHRTEALVVNGAYRGQEATLLEVDQAGFCAKLRLDAGLISGRILERVPYEDFSKLHMPS